MALNLLQRTETRRGLFPIEVVSLAYGALTTVLILFLHERMDHPLTMVLERIGIAVITVLLLLIYQRYSCKLTSFLRTLFQLGLLAYWYPDTYEFNRLFPNSTTSSPTASRCSSGASPPSSSAGCCRLWDGARRSTWATSPTTR